ncbi:MAG: acyltransferase family protein, partial [Candidatus Acidiferrales bacterium]
MATAETIAGPASRAPSANLTERPGRVVSLDVLRGLKIAAMILVNDPGSWSHVYAPLEHADWNGWTPTDLVFPAFLIIVGVSMALSFASRASRGATRRTLAVHIARRSALIFGIGLFLNGFPSFDFTTIRIMGVLQRIAVCYLAAGLFYLLLIRRKVEPDSAAPARSRAAVIAGAVVFLLVGYWALMNFVPVPGIGAGHLGKSDNLGAYVDRALLGGHLWAESETWDPEGLLSTIPAIATLLIGVLAGEWLRSDRSGRRKALGFAGAGAALLLAGRLLDPS